MYYHRVGTPQSADELAFEDVRNPQRFHTVSTTEDERFAILDVSERGKGKDGNALYLRDLNATDKTWKADCRRIGNDTYQVIGNVGDAFLIQTNAHAPNWKIVAVRSARERHLCVARHRAGEARGHRERQHGRRQAFVTYLKDVTTRIYAHALDGAENQVELPGVGIASGLGGNHDDAFVFYTFTSFTNPRRFIGTTSRRGSPRFTAPPTSPASRPPTTRRSRCSSRARTARACRCSSSTGRD